MDPKSISAAMNMEPQFSWKTGDKRVTPKGEVLDGVRDASYWCAQLDLPGREGIAAAIRSFLPFLLDRKDFLDKLSASGGSSELWVGWFVESSAGDTLDSELMRSLGALHVDIALSAYAEIDTVDGSLAIGTNP